MSRLIPNRLSVRHVLSDHWRSMRKHGSSVADAAARYALLVVPLAVGLVSYGLEWRLLSPTALLPATSLLAGVLLATSGQLISLRARIADSVLLSGNQRVKNIYREALSGVLVAALAALLDAVLLAILSSVAIPQGETGWRLDFAIVGCALALTVSTFLVLMFLASVRRLYLAYLEAFENGEVLQRPRSTSTDALPSAEAGQELPSSAEDDDSSLSEFEIPTQARRHRSV
ncbi:hypothetical protein AB0N29_01855 [Nocardioides sp. NPDC092400]|uniref:hypothetical protein n=1 Tax=Nocardioides sp. NPDC092400 TaxID=3155196 RepID=UPI003419838F